MINIGIGIPFGQRSAGIDPQAKIAFDSLQSAGFTTPQGITGINAAFKTIKTIYGTSDITTAISFFGDPSLAYQIGAGSGTTLGQAIRTLPNIIDPTRATDAVQTTAASQPLLLTHTTGNNYWFGSGVDGNHLTTPTSTANSNNGNKEIIARVDCQGTAFYTFASKNNQAYCFFLLNGVFRFNATTDLLGLTQYSATTNIATNFSGWVKCTAEFGGGILTIKFFTSTDGVTYTQIGSNVTGPGNNFISTSGTLYVGSINGGSDFRGRIHRVTIANSVNGTPVVDFNPNQYNPSNSQTQWVSTSGETWTINTGTATTGYKGVLVDRTMTMFDAIDDTISNTDTTTFRTTFVSLKIHRTGSFFAGVINNNTGSVNAASQWFYTGETANIVDANNVLLDTRYINNIINSSYTPYRLFLGQIDLGATPNTSNGKLIGFLASNNYLCGIMTSCIQTYNNPTPTQRTEMYNYIRSINGNSF